MFLKEHFNMTQSKKFKMTTHRPTNCHHVIKGVYEQTTYPPYSSLRHHRCFEITNKKKATLFQFVEQNKKTSELFLPVGIGQITKQKTFEVLLYVGKGVNKKNIPLAKKTKVKTKRLKRNRQKGELSLTSFSRTKVFF